MSGSGRPKKGPKIEFLVSFELPPGASAQTASDYVASAVLNWCGSLQPPGMGAGGPDPHEPGDPMFNLKSKTVRVKYIPPRNRKVRGRPNARINATRS